jgi:hypothetical protein
MLSLALAPLVAGALARLGPLAVAGRAARQRLAGAVPAQGTLVVIAVAALVAGLVWTAHRHLGQRGLAAERTRTIAETTTALERAALAAENAALRAAMADASAALARRATSTAAGNTALGTYQAQQLEIRDASTVGRIRTIVIPAGDPWLVRHRPFGAAGGVR